MILVLLSCPIVWAAQQGNDRKPYESSDRPMPNATVTGHVYLDDTKGPGRKATVYLQPAALLQADAPPDRSGVQDQGPVTASVETRFDGSYLFTHVAPGSYYLIATSAGYISPLVALSLAEGRSEYEEWTPLGPQQKTAKNRILDSMTRVDVQGGQPASADVTLERGGAVSGNITYDDGGSAAGLQVKVLPRTLRNHKEAWLPVPTESHSFIDDNHTDDRGNYRISGLPPGKYVVEVLLEFTDYKKYFSRSGSSGSGSNAHTSRLSVYSGNTPRETKAAGFTLQAREERPGEDILIPISKLNTIKGTIISARDGHPVNSGQVDLLHADDRSFVGSQSLTEDDPTFTFSFVFEGDYFLNTPASADVDYEPVPPTDNSGPPQFSTHILHFYGPALRTIHVEGNMEGVRIAVPEPTPQEAQAYKEMMQQEEKSATDPQ